MDTGPTALFYRADLFEEAGFPSEPDEVAAAMDTWDKYFDAAEEYIAATDGKYLIPNVDMVYYQGIRQQGTRYMNERNQFIGDGPQIREPWDRAVQAHRRKLTPDAAGTRETEWNAAIASGKVASFVDAVWNAEILKDAAADSEGNWRVCRAPGGPGNAGGSFVGITKASRDPEAAWEVIKWVQSPPNQIFAYNEISLFPAARQAVGSEDVRVADKFFGGQIINDVFGESALNVQPVYLSPYDSLIDTAFNGEIANIWAADKDPERAWQDALDEVDRQLAHRGLI
jgi:cellobiose transport system substrate-binding protein